MFSLKNRPIKAAGKPANHAPNPQDVRKQMEHVEAALDRDVGQEVVFELFPWGTPFRLLPERGFLFPTGSGWLLRKGGAIANGKNTSLLVPFKCKKVAL